MKPHDAIMRELEIINSLISRIKQAGETAGTLTCPVCNNVIRYFIASNGHSRGECLGRDCLNWME